TGSAAIGVGVELEAAAVGVLVLGRLVDPELAVAAAVVVLGVQLEAVTARHRRLRLPRRRLPGVVRVGVERAVLLTRLVAAAADGRRHSGGQDAGDHGEQGKKSESAAADAGHSNSPRGDVLPPFRHSRAGLLLSLT